MDNQGLLDRHLRWRPEAPWIAICDGGPWGLVLHLLYLVPSLSLPTENIVFRALALHISNGMHARLPDRINTQWWGRYVMGTRTQAPR